MTAGRRRLAAKLSGFPLPHAPRADSEAVASESAGLPVNFLELPTATGSSGPSHGFLQLRRHIRVLTCRVRVWLVPTSRFKTAPPPRQQRPATWSRVGSVLRDVGGLPDSDALASRADRDPHVRVRRFTGASESWTGRLHTALGSSLIVRVIVRVGSPHRHNTAA